MSTTSIAIPKRGQRFHKVCDYIVLAEFDIDTGSTVRHQYPCAFPDIKEDWFAENMLPEGVHNRAVDYTYMILNRKHEQIDESFWISPKSFDVLLEPSLDETEQQKYLLYGLNLVITKYDSNVRRGAIVKAMAIFSRYSFIEVLKKPLECALEHYFLQPTRTTLEVSENSSFVVLHS